VDTALGALGWTVLRFWDFEIERAVEDVLTRVSAALAAGSQSGV
jgi:very-short-patch-repair endonuclease